MPVKTLHVKRTITATAIKLILLLQAPTFSQWTQLGIDLDGEASGDLSGRSVSLSSDGSRVAIGALGNAGNGSSSGHTRIYKGFSVVAEELPVMPFGRLVLLGLLVLGVGTLTYRKIG